MAEQSYAGDVDARRAWELLSKDPKAVLIDVRTKPEWRYVGHPDLKQIGKNPIFVEWQAYPDLQVNPGFTDEVSGNAIAKEAPIFLLCRSGVRSKAAAIALTKIGYKHCYNIQGGFEGPKDSAGHRGSADGWKASNLPWQQE
ncbi:MAG TPA: rhodanese-like domain-containing protein [Alphaproteobacteria bacterium]|jgi:rhodanese-related sulfurtransferase|nr:rhodanese-like domain-containing protein [Alphaproteobacteria bacterium]